MAAIRRSATESAGPTGDAKGEMGIRQARGHGGTQSGSEKLGPKGWGTPEEPAVIRVTLVGADASPGTRQ